MHGLINRALQCFLRDTYGQQVWGRIATAARLDFTDFEALLVYPDILTEQVLTAAEAELRKPANDLLEDLGTYLVSHPNVEALRRLLRFGGTTFAEFLYSLEELPGRTRLAVPDLELPRLHLSEPEAGRFVLHCDRDLPHYGRVMVGILRAMADDYGTLAFLEHTGQVDGRDTIAIDVHDAGFAQGRSFDLAVPVTS